jgi:DNA-directed RNA polymerase specialized sigma24 family protein
MIAPQNVRMQELHNEYAPMVTKIAKREHKGAVGVSVDDVVNEIWLTVFKKIKHLDGYTAMGMGDFATKAARQYLIKERIDRMYALGNFIYTPEIVEQYLTDAVWANVEDVPDIDGRVDVTDEVNKLPLHDRQLLFKKYGLGENPSREDHAARKTIDRAVVRITNNLNLQTNQVRVDSIHV